MKAWQYLQEHDWIQGALGQGTDGSFIQAREELIDREQKGEVCAVCMLGAIVIATNRGTPPDVPNTELFDVIGAVMANLPPLQPQDNLSIAIWNDMSGRTKDEVIAVLKDLDI